MAYPELIRLLMDRTYRDEQLARVRPRLLAGALADGLSREYTLEEIAIVTRRARHGCWASAARVISARSGRRRDDLRRRGQCGGHVQDAALCRQSGRLVVEEAQLRRAPAGTRLRAAGVRSPDRIRLRRYFDRYSTVSFDHYPVRLPGAPCAIAG